MVWSSRRTAVALFLNSRLSLVKMPSIYGARAAEVAIDLRWGRELFVANLPARVRRGAVVLVPSEGV